MHFLSPNPPVCQCQCPFFLPFPRAENEISALFQEKGRDFILRLGGGRILLKAIKTAIENIHCVLMPFFITAHVGVHPHNFCILGHALVGGLIGQSGYLAYLMKIFSSSNLISRHCPTTSFSLCAKYNSFGAECKMRVITRC